MNIIGKILASRSLVKIYVSVKLTSIMFYPNTDCRFLRNLVSLYQNKQCFIRVHSTLPT